MEGNNVNSKACLNLVLLGKTGAGKSASGNTILGRQAFVSKKSSKSVTPDIAVESGSVDGIPVTVYDTPGFCDAELSEEEIVQKHENVLQKCESGRCVFLLVISTDRFTEETKKTVEKIEKILGEKRLEKTWILFTKGDDLEAENMTIQEFIEDSYQLKTVVQKYKQKYHVFNNREKDTAQVKTLLSKIQSNQKCSDTMGKEEKLNNLLKKKMTKNVELDAPVSSLSPRRIVLLGKSGAGKSAAGNTILGQRDFTSVMRMNSVTSVCSEAQATLSGRSVSVVDTPGFFDTKMKPEDLVTEIARSVYLSSPGPHAFLIVFPVNGRFTDQEQQIPQQIEKLFGQEVLKYSIILFTHGDQLEGQCVKELIEENSRLKDLVQQCGGKCHVFNNKAVNNRDQVNELLQKIDSMVEQNGGGHYSPEMFEDAQRFRREEEEQRQRGEEQKKQAEEKQTQGETGKVRKDTEISAEMEMEEIKKNEPSSGFHKFFAKYKNQMYMLAVAAGFIIGGGLGGTAAHGLLGAAVVGGLCGGAECRSLKGAAVGVAVGVVGGAAVGVVGGALISGATVVAKAACVGVVGGAAVGGVAGVVSTGTGKGALIGAAAGAGAGGAIVGGAVLGGAAVGGAAVGGATFGGATVSGAVAGASVSGAIIDFCVSGSVE